MNWKKPETELEYIYLTMLLWKDIWDNKYTFKEHSKYYKYVRDMNQECPLCEYYDCDDEDDEDDCPDCPLEDCNDSYWKWLVKDMDGAKEIYEKCRDKVEEMEMLE